MLPSLRNLKITSKIDKSSLETSTHAMSVKAKVGLGPFTITGGYDKRDQGSQTDTKISETGITFAGVQVLGFLGTVPAACRSHGEVTPVRLDMKRLFLLVFAVAAGLRAEPVSVVLDKLYAKLAAAYQSTAAMGQGKAFLVLANPGFPLGKINLADDYEISQLADRIPLVARLYQPSASTYSDTYRTIISQSEASNFVDQTARQAALTAKRQLWDPRRPGRPTPAYASYLQYQAACADAQDALSLAETEQRATGSAVLPNWRPPWRRPGRTGRPWATASSSTMPRPPSTATPEATPRRSSPTSWPISRPAPAGTATPEYCPVLIVPPPSAWKSEDGWRGFRFTQSEKSQAPAAQAGTDKPSDEVVESVHIGLEVKRVNFKRPWLDETVFKSQRWRLLKSSLSPRSPPAIRRTRTPAACPC